MFTRPSISNNLGKESTLLLTFDSDMPGMYENYFPVAWRSVPYVLPAITSNLAILFLGLPHLEPRVGGLLLTGSNCQLTHDSRRARRALAGGDLQAPVRQNATYFRRYC
jgi:hypothetical protein